MERNRPCGICLAFVGLQIYPSEFGKERLRLEESQGPPELRADSDDDGKDDRWLFPLPSPAPLGFVVFALRPTIRTPTQRRRCAGRSYREKKRDYQFKRLKYFYAVAECDSAATAAKIYQECDGLEYESSCSVLDLRWAAAAAAVTKDPCVVVTA